MVWSFPAAHGWVSEEVSLHNDPIKVSMHRLIDKCETTTPHPDWSSFREISYSNTSPITDWISSVFEQHPPKDAISGLWFEIFQTLDDMGRRVGDLSVVGSDSFSADIDDIEWAASALWRPRPTLHSPVLAQIVIAAYNQSGGDNPALENMADYTLSLGYACLAVRDALKGVNPMTLSGCQSQVGIAVGFSSGDSITVGILSPGGLCPPGESRVSLRHNANEPRANTSIEEHNLFPNLPEFNKYIKSQNREEFLNRKIFEIRHSSFDKLRNMSLQVASKVAPHDKNVKDAVWDATNDSSLLVRRTAFRVLPSLSCTGHADARRLERLLKSGVDPRIRREVRQAYEELANSEHSD